MHVYKEFEEIPDTKEQEGWAKIVRILLRNLGTYASETRGASEELVMWNNEQNGKLGRVEDGTKAQSTNQAFGVELHTSY